MRMGQGVRTGLGHGGITCVLQTQFSSFTKLCPFFDLELSKCSYSRVLAPACGALVFHYEIARKE